MRPKLFKRAIDASTNAMALLQLDPGLPDRPVFVYVNHALETLTGYAAHALIGQEWWWPIDAEPDGAQRGERKDGTALWIEAHVTPFDNGLYLAVLHDVTTLQRQFEQLEHRAGHDALTGLANRYLLQDRLEQAIAHAQRRGEGFSIVLLDLDDFKHINDRFGHQAGDEVLKHFADCLTSVLRTGDTAVRLGGDEFALLLTDAADPIEARTVVDRIARSLNTPLVFGDHVCELSFSAGVSLFPAHGIDTADLIQHADLSMYRHKRARGSSVRPPSWTVTQNVVAFG